MPRCPSCFALLAATPLTLLASGCATPTIAESAKAEWSQFGVSADPTTATLVPIGFLLESERTEAVTLDGTIDALDVARGAWFRVRDVTGAIAYVRFADRRSYIPRNALGRRAFVLGTVESRTLSIDLQRRLAADAGFSDLAVARITAPTVVPVVNAEAVWIQGSGLTDPYRPIGVESADLFDSVPRTTP